MVKVEVAEESFFSDIKPANESIGLILFALIVVSSIYSLHVTSKENKKIASILVKHLDKYKRNFDKSYEIYKKIVQKDLSNKLKAFLSDKYGKCSLHIEDMLNEKEYLERYVRVLVNLIKSNRDIPEDAVFSNSVSTRFSIHIKNFKIKEEMFDNIFSFEIPKIYTNNQYVNIVTKDGNLDDEIKMIEMEYWLCVNTFISNKDIKELKVLLKNAKSKSKD